MKIKFQILILFIFSCCVISCNEDSVSSDPVNEPPLQQQNFKYPFEISSFWYYNTRNFVTNIRPDSIRTYYNEDTIKGFGGAAFVKDTILNSDTVRLLSNTHSEPGHAHVTLEYYKQTDEGLIRIASISNGTNFGPFTNVEINHRYELNGLIFNSVRDILNHYKQDYSYDGKLIFDNPPVTALKYPIVQNEEWLLKTIGKIEITKKYTTFESVTVPAGTFFCNKIKRNWYYNSSVPDPKIVSHDYFSKEGMMKRELRINDILVYNSEGPIGYMDIKEETEVNIYTHP